jgi:thioesterase domain-containing protein
VAWETARRLEDLGHEVGLLVLIDSRPHDPHPPGSPDLDDTALEVLLGVEARVGEEPLPGLRAMVRAHLHALRGYRSEPVVAPVALFLAADRRGGEEAADRAALWRPLAGGGLTVEILPGDHFHLLSGPGADLLAAKLRARLAEFDDQPA